MSSRLTKEITYNLRDRGRQHSGVDRSNIDFDAMVNIINSAGTQEFVHSGQMLGYYGHQIRQRYGMNPPETVTINDKLIRLEPAIRTVMIHADKDYNVTHKQEFLDNDAGNHALRQYTARIGGFSTSCDYRVAGPQLIPVNFAGMDYVFQPNYVTNAGNGLFDSATGQEIGQSLLIQSMLDNEIVQLYDHISEASQSMDYLKALSARASQAEEELRRERLRQQRRMAKAKEIEQSHFDMALCATMSFDSAVQEADRFLLAEIQADQEEQKRLEAESKSSLLTFGRWLGGL